MREKSKELIEAEKREAEEGRQAISQGRGKSEKKPEKAEKKQK